MAKSKHKRVPKMVLKLPDLEQSTVIGRCGNRSAPQVRFGVIEH